MRNSRLVTLIVVLLLAVSTVAGSVSAAVEVDASALRAAVTPEGVIDQLHAIANASTGGNRLAGSTGYDDAAAYVHDKLVAAGYNVSYQPFSFMSYQVLGTPVLQQVSPTPQSYGYGEDFLLMEYSGSGDVTAAVQAVDLLLPSTGGSTSGCEASDFAGFTPGSIALIQRGTCTFAQKALNAQAAGAAAAIIFNEGDTEGRVALINGTLGGTGVNIPVLDTPFALGTTFASLAASGLTLHIQATTLTEERQTKNVIADTVGGRDDRVVVVGAHLDSVQAGLGINDNGSGAATILEIALQMAKLNVEPYNKVRFAFWSAEEQGLLGATYYVSQLSAQGVKNTALNLNFDMIASPNYVRFVYDGDGSATPTAGPNGSKVIEEVFTDYFASQGLASAPTAFDGRSDYGPFIDVGIPAGGLFAGAEGIKTADEQTIYGGTASEPYDPYYHTAYDDFANVNSQALDEMADAAAHAVLSFAMTTSSVNGTDKGNGTGQFKNQLTYLGPYAVH